MIVKQAALRLFPRCARIATYGLQKGDTRRAQILKLAKTLGFHETFP
jgi:hypothetical protein